MKTKRCTAFICAVVIALTAVFSDFAVINPIAQTAQEENSYSRYPAQTQTNAVNTNEDVYALSYLDVSVTDGFFRDYIKHTVCNILPVAIVNIEGQTGGISNIINASKKNNGLSYEAFSGALYVDSDVHKVLESMCMALKIDPMGDEEIIASQKSIAEKLEEWIPYYVDAQEESGYFDTYYTLNTDLTKFSDVGKHELYCMGHFIEAAIAHYECTDRKDTRLFNAAIKCADYLYRTFGFNDGKRKQIAGHQEIEIALLKLANLCENLGDSYSAKAKNYKELAAFFLEVRGDYSYRSVKNKTSEYYQDHAKVEDQTTAVGHAVRAQYMYTAMTELALADSNYKEKYSNTLNSLWDDLTHTKQYVTGGVGQSAVNEGFAESYELNNLTSYCETCAGIANMMWNRSMGCLYTNSQYADMVETDIYNTVLGCVNFDGNTFFYRNTLASLTGVTRNFWYGTACCPPNLTRTILSVGGYIYNLSDDSVYVNQYISNEANFSVSGADVTADMQSEMPWQGGGSITLELDKTAEFTLCLRMPYWSDKAEIKLNGEKIDVSADKDGYLKVKREWTNGDKIEFEFSMPVLFEETSKQVSANVGYTSLRRGPIVYCAEEIDNDFNIFYSYVDKNSKAELVWTDSLDGKADPCGVRDLYMIKLGGYTDGLTAIKQIEWTFIPFYARSNRQSGGMTVYVQKEALNRELNEYGVPSASYTYKADSVFNLNDGSYDTANRWTSYKSGAVEKNPWVQYDFEAEVMLSGCNIWWYEDDSGVKLPDGFEIYYKNSETGDFVPVTHESEYLCTTSNGFSSYKFDTVNADAIKIVINNSSAAAGIVEWRLVGEKIEIANPEKSIWNSPYLWIPVIVLSPIIIAVAVIIIIFKIKKKPTKITNE